MKYDELLAEIFGVMRYCYKNDNDQPATASVEEWEGTEEDPGIKQYIRSLLFDERKKAFLSGFLSGSKTAFQDVIVHVNVPKERVLEWVETDCRIGAERCFQTWEKE